MYFKKFVSKCFYSYSPKRRTRNASLTSFGQLGLIYYFRHFINMDPMFFPKPASERGGGFRTNTTKVRYSV